MTLVVGNNVDGGSQRGDVIPAAKKVTVEIETYFFRAPFLVSD